MGSVFRKAESLSLNLKHLFSKMKLKVPEISSRTQIPKTTLYNLLLQNHEPKISLLETLSRFFGINVSQLIGELPLISDAFSVPILSQNSIDYINGKIYYTTSPDTEFVFRSKNSDKYFFAISIDRDIYPKYEEGTILIFEESQAFLKGDIILISQQKTKPVLKTVLVEGTETYLKSVSNDIPAQVYDPANTVIFGVLREVRISKF